MRKALTLTLLLAAGSLSGCKADSYAAVVPVGLCSPPTDATNCSMAGKCLAFLGAPQLDYFIFVAEGVDTLTTVTTYVNGPMDLFMQWDNQALDNSDEGSGRTNTHDAYLTDLELSFSVNASPAFSIPTRTVPMQPTVIPANSNATPVVEILPRTLIPTLATQIAAGSTAFIEVTMKGKGYFGDSSEFETGPFTIPIWVHNSPKQVCVGQGGLRAVCLGVGYSGTRATCQTSIGGTSGFLISGTITGLTSDGLVLSTPGMSDLNIPAGSTSFTFGSVVPDGWDYDVTVTDPTAPAQTCTVTNGTGTVNGADVTNITITCT